MNAKCTFVVTNHARERFVERCSNNENRKAYAHLKDCKGCQRCVSLLFKLKKEVVQSRQAWDNVIVSMLENARETRIHHNNEALMRRLTDKYGDKPAYYLLNDDVLFLVVDSNEPGKKVCVTCFDAKDSVLGDFVRRPKFKKKEPAMV